MIIVQKINISTIGNFFIFFLGFQTLCNVLCNISSKAERNKIRCVLSIFSLSLDYEYFLYVTNYLDTCLGVIVKIHVPMCIGKHVNHKQQRKLHKLKIKSKTKRFLPILKEIGLHAQDCLLKNSKFLSTHTNKSTPYDPKKPYQRLWFICLHRQ